MSAPGTTTRTDAATPQDVRTDSPLPRAVRTALLVVTVAVSCYIAYCFGRWWALANHPAPPRTTVASDGADLDPLAAALPLGGQWAFDELDWSLKSQLVDRSTLDGEFEQLGKSPLSKLDPQLPDADPELIELITAMNIQPVERAGDLVYRVNRRDLRAELITRQLGQLSKAVAFAVAYPVSGDTWQLYVFTPKQATGDSAAAARHLLPLPADARRSGGRFAEDGRVLLELISLDSTTEKLLDDWKAAGWEIRSSGIANPADFSVLCARGEEVVYAWSADPHDSLQNLMLVHTPTPADTSP